MTKHITSLPLWITCELWGQLAKTYQLRPVRTHLIAVIVITIARLRRIIRLGTPHYGFTATPTRYLRKDCFVVPYKEPSDEEGTISDTQFACC